MNAGIKVATVYGDRDYRYNWLGAENLSLETRFPGSSAVRKFDNFSFSRVFEAGRAVSAYQPETVYHIFMRSMFNRDIATGKISTSGSLYSSSGPPSSFQVKDVLPGLPEECPVDGKHLPNGT